MCIKYIPNHDEKWDEMPDAIFYFWITKKTTRQAELNEIHIEIIDDDEELRKKGD